MTYDGYGRLVTAPNSVYEYNALGQRIRKTVNGANTYFHYDPEGKLLFEQDPAGNKLHYVYLNGQLLARIDNSTIYYYHTDYLGTPRAMTDASRTVVWQANYEPFGKVMLTVQAVVNNIRFLGQYQDQETGLFYNYYRYYDSGTGRYDQADPIGLDGGLNVYAYVDGNPISRIDPKGESWVVPAIGACIAVGTVYLFKVCMERCTGTALPRTLATPPPAPGVFAKCSNYCFSLANLFNFGADPIPNAAGTVGGEIGKGLSK